MATYVENLRTRRNAIATELAALSTSAAGGKPNVSGSGGGTDHVGYKDGLYRELDRLDRLIRDALTTDAAIEGPFEIAEVTYSE